MEESDVIIVGAGPVGLALAGLLGRDGHRVLVLERHTEAYGLPRAVRFDGEAMRLFQALGIVDEIAPESIAAEAYVWFGADGRPVLEIDERAPAPSGWAASYSFWQPALESALEAAAAACPTVELRRGWAVEAVAQGPDRVTVTARPAHGGRSEAFGAAYVVGADGARSIVRRGCGIELDDLGFRERWVVADVRPHDMATVAHLPVAAQWCDPARPTVVVRNGASHRRWEFMLLAHETREQYEDPAAVWALLAPWLGAAQGTLVRHAVYEFTATLAQRLSCGRVALAGDAAHTMPPFMAEGLCTGLRDAANLAWRLDLLLRDGAAPGLLADYDRERRPHARALIELSIAMGRLACTTDPAAAAARDAALRSGAAPPPPPRPGLADGTLQAAPRPAVVGQLGVQGIVRTPEGAEGAFDDVVGHGFALVGDDPRGALDAARSAALEALGAHVVALSPEADGRVADVGGALRGWLRANGLTAVLVRPDGYVFGAAEHPSHVAAVVDELLLRLAGRPAAAGA